MGDQDLQRLPPGLVTEVEGGEHGVGHQGLIANLGQLDQPGAISEAARKIGRRPQCEPGLPDTSWPDETDEAGSGELPPDLGKLPAAAHKARRLGGQIARGLTRSGHRDYEVTPSSSALARVDYVSNP
jgi:hypothetical protein